MDYVRYLASKRPVDDRALNESVMDSFKANIANSARGKPKSSLRVLEVGAGIGTMLVRLARNGTFDECVCSYRALFGGAPCSCACWLETTRSTNKLWSVSFFLFLLSFGTVEYHLVDIKREVLVEARALIDRELSESGGRQEVRRPAVAILRKSTVSGVDAVHHAGDNEDSSYSEQDMRPLNGIQIPGGGSLVCTFEVGDAMAHAARHAGKYDALVASAVLDLFDIASSSKTLLGCLRRSDASPRAFLFALTFDGVTCFLPPRPGDDMIETAFHEAMGSDSEDGKPKAHTGRRLLQVLVASGAQAIVGGSSSWLVLPENGSYPSDEQFFIECILDYISGSAKQIEAQEPEARGWMAERLEQLKCGTLMYIAHNMDYSGRYDP